MRGFGPGCDQSTRLRDKLHRELTRDEQLSVCARDEQGTYEPGSNETAPDSLQR